jgi:hypothetical protein
MAYHLTGQCEALVPSARGPWRRCCRCGPERVRAKTIEGVRVMWCCKQHIAKAQTGRHLHPWWVLGA